MSTTVTKLPAPQAVSVQEQSPLLVPQMFDAMWRLAEAMARAKTVPEHLRGSPGDCLRVVELAHRCGQSPFALADHIYFTNGRMAADGQVMAGLVNTSPKIEGSLVYRYSGSPADPASYRCTVVGRLRGEVQPREVSISMAQGLADSRGAKARWQSDPEQMMAYYGARKWARRHAPEVTMGLYTPDELRAAEEGGTVLDITPTTEPTHDAETGEVLPYADRAMHSEPAKPAKASPDDFWARASYHIPVNGKGLGHFQSRMLNAIKIIPGQLELIKLQQDCLAEIDQLQREAPEGYRLLQEAIAARMNELPDIDEAPFGDE
jgi:hypothetical protein